MFHSEQKTQNVVSSTSLPNYLQIQQHIAQNSGESKQVFTFQTLQTLQTLQTRQYISQKNLNKAEIKQLINLIKDKNQKATICIAKQQIDDALIQLIQAEKILQHISQKNNIDKKIIICILHNLACSYQKNWQLQICSNYLQALIYNMNSYLHQKSEIIFSQISVQVKQNKKEFSKKRISKIVQIQNMQRLGYYYLQYCAVNSQIKNHSGALIAARKSIQTLKKMFKSISVLLKDQNKHTKQSKDEYQAKYRLVTQISKINDNISINQYEMILETTKYYLRKWASRKVQDSHINTKWLELQQKYKNFSIGTIAQINPLYYSDILNICQQNYLQLLSYQSLLEKILVFIIGYFTISTELRLMANLRHNQNTQQNLTQSSQFKQSQIYHLFCIMLTSIFVPFEILYMKHILLSYRNHFQFDLNQYCQYSDNKVYEDFLFTISQIKKPSLLALSFQDSLRISEIGNQLIFQQGASGTQIRFIKNQNQIEKKSQTKKQQRKTKSKSNHKKNTKSKSKVKQKSQNKKSTVKTISALSAQSRPKDKKIKLKNESSKSKSKSKTKSSLEKKINKKSFYIKSIHSQKHQYNPFLNQNINIKKKSGKEIKVDPYYNLKKQSSRSKNHKKIIYQTNQYFLEKKQKQKRSSKKQSKQLSPNDLYYHKFKKQVKKSKPKPKSSSSLRKQ